MHDIAINANIIKRRQVLFSGKKLLLAAVRTGSSKLLLFCRSLAPDSRFSLGQTNIRRKLLLHHLGSYLE